MMKRTIAFLLCLVLALAVSVPALAAGAPKISKQPETATVSEKGTVSFSIKATNFRGLTWKFVNPETGEEFTGKTISSAFKGLKVDGANKQKITLKKVPAEMHGWIVYAHLTGNGYEVDSDRVQLLIKGMDPSGITPANTDSVPDTTTEAVPETTVPASSDTGTEVSSAAPAADTQPEAVQSSTIIIRGENVTLYPLDEEGGILQDQAASELSFEQSARFAVQAPGTVRYWRINDMMLEPYGSMDGFTFTNVTSDMTISAVLSGVQVASADSGEGVLVTCIGCTFSVSGDDDVSLTSGRVPSGTAITIMANSRDAAAGGYSINGGDFERAGKLSFRLVVTEDTVIQTK